MPVPIKAGSVRSPVGVPAAAVIVHAGLHCPVLLATPLLWCCSPALGLSASQLTLTEVFEANAFSQVLSLGHNLSENEMQYTGYICPGHIQQM